MLCLCVVVFFVLCGAWVRFIRGFSTNVANYQPIGVACQTWDWCLPNNNHGSDPCCNDPCHLASQCVTGLCGCGCSHS